MTQHILTQDDLKELTGSQRTQRQMSVLAQHQIKFITGYDGKIRTTWAAVNAALIQQREAETEEPDLDFLRHG